MYINLRTNKVRNLKILNQTIRDYLNLKPGEDCIYIMDLSQAHELSVVELEKIRENLICYFAHVKRITSPHYRTPFEA
ncbi:MAG: hypothetical protein KC585_03005 [Candidatus Magasanikbacteria bacterium]|nr:hypothetical protein [Candidatus Magasanikbacteria bacterium]